MSPEDVPIDVITSPLSYRNFYKEYIIKNKPCVLPATYTEHWPCHSDWVSDDGKPNMEYFREQYGHLTAPVVNCAKQVYSSHEKCEMNIAEFCDYWKERKEKLLYLKDWHLQMNVNGHAFYKVPKFFTSDWLNEYWDKVREDDDYRFVYIGVKGSWTTFHADVFRSFSWSANICGLKKWLLYPPGEEELLKDKHGYLPFDVTSEVDYKTHPDSLKACKPVIVYQNAGEIIFVPTGWHHQVYNVEDTISVNHNWVNAACIGEMYRHLDDELIKVKKEIDDCRTMDGFCMQCQLILKVSSGIDFKEFYEMVTYLVKTRLKFLYRECSHEGNYDEIVDLLSRFYITSIPSRPYLFKELNIGEEIDFVNFDLCKLKLVLEKLMSHEDFLEITDSADAVSEGKSLIEEINKLVNNGELS